MEHVRQNAHIKRMHAQKHPCPHCGEPLSFEESKTGQGDLAKCRECKETVRYVVYLFGGQGFDKVEGAI